MLEGFVEKQVIAFAEPRLEPDVLLAALSGIGLPDFIDVRGLAEKLSVAGKSWLHQKVGMGDLPEEMKAIMFFADDPDEALDEPVPESRRWVRKRCRRYLQTEKGMSRSEARARVARLTDEEIDQAVGQLPVQSVGDWLSGLWTWLKENWWPILKTLLPLLLLFLGSNSNGDTNMQFTKDNAAEFLSSHGMQSDGDFDMKAEFTAKSFNDLIALGIKLTEILAKSKKVYDIIMRPGWTPADLIAKWAEIKELFNIAPAPPATQTVNMP